MFSDPIAYFLSWSTYGSRLPGDERFWTEQGKGTQLPDPTIHEAAASLMTEDPVTLSPEQRAIVDGVIVRHCEVRGWMLHARNARTTHVHAVVSAPGVEPETVREQLKAWCSRRLSEAAGLRGRSRNGLRRWWAEKGSVQMIYDDDGLGRAVDYVIDGQ